MEQTFNDLYKEQKSRTERGLFSFVLWMFFETSTGIIREHILILRQGATMKNIPANHNSAAITSFILAVPLGLTYVAFMFNIEGQQGNMNTLGRIVIYGGLLLLPLAFMLNLRPI
jgi:hypothetical protein